MYLQSTNAVKRMFVTVLTGGAGGGGKPPPTPPPPFDLAVNIFWLVS